MAEKRDRIPVIMRLRILSIMMILAAASASVKAQEDVMYKWEIGAGIGLTTYQGDFNGKLLSSANSAPMASVMLRRVFNPYTTVRFDLGFGKVKGASKDMETYYPHFDTQGNVGHGVEYKFNNSIVDFSSTFEYNFWPYGTGRDYRGAKKLTPFIFLGMGFTFTNCKDGWVDYSTVAPDSIVAPSNNKSDFTASLLLGVGVKYKIAPRLNLGLEWGEHFTFSDKLDGVKDPYLISSAGMFKNTDCFSVLKASLTYSFGPKCRTCMNSDWHY